MSDFSQPNSLRIALILPNEKERAFYSDGTGNPKLFHGLSGKEPISHESLSDRVLRNSDYGFQPTKILRSLPVIEGVRSVVRTPILGPSSFHENVATGATRLFAFDSVVEAAERDQDFIDPIDLHILTAAFEKHVRRRTVIDLSA